MLSNIKRDVSSAFVRKVNFEFFFRYLDDEERDFWKYIIQHYLHPLDEDKTEKARIKRQFGTKYAV